MKHHLPLLSRGRRPTSRADRPRWRPTLEALEARHLLDGGLVNVLVNNPALDTSAQDTQSETAIVLGAGSKIVVAYNDSGITSAATPALTGFSRSANGGVTFADHGSLPLNHDVGDPVLARSSKTGTIFLSTLGVDSAYDNPTPPPPIVLVGREQVNVFRSTNNGAAFHDPVNATPGFVANVDYMDKPWIAVDNFPGPGYGNVYLVTAHASFSTTVSSDILLTRSTDDGLTWGLSGGTLLTSSPGLLFSGPNVTVGADHAVYVFWYNMGPRSTYLEAQDPEIVMCKSIDLGVTFSEPVTVTRLSSSNIFGDLGLTDSSGRYFRSNAFPQATINPVTGDIYLAFNDWGNKLGNDRGNIYFTQSSDGGRKWSKPVQINDDLTPNDQWFPALAVTPDGSHAGLFWYDRRLDPANNLIDRFGAIGAVSGHTVSFGANFRITDVSFPPAFGQDPIISPSYMGDYDQATADNDYFYTTWSDNRLANAFHANQPDVRLAKVPVGWAGTASSLAAQAGLDGALVSRPAVADAIPFALPSAGAAAALTDHSALLSREASWKVLALDAYFLDLARTSPTTGGVTSGHTAPWHTISLARPALPEPLEQLAPPRTRVTGTATPAPAGETSHRPADDWTTDVLISVDLWWDGQDATWFVA